MTNETINVNPDKGNAYTNSIEQQTEGQGHNGHEVENHPSEIEESISIEQNNKSLAPSTSVTVSGAVVGGTTSNGKDNKKLLLTGYLLPNNLNGAIGLSGNANKAQSWANVLYFFEAHKTQRIPKSTFDMLLGSMFFGA